MTPSSRQEAKSLAYAQLYGKETPVLNTHVHPLKNPLLMPNGNPPLARHYCLVNTPSHYAIDTENHPWYWSACLKEWKAETNINAEQVREKYPKLCDFEGTPLTESCMAPNNKPFVEFRRSPCYGTGNNVVCGLDTNGTWWRWDTQNPRWYCSSTVNPNAPLCDRSGRLLKVQFPQESDIIEYRTSQPGRGRVDTGHFKGKATNGTWYYWSSQKTWCLSGENCESYALCDKDGKAIFCYTNLDVMPNGKPPVTRYKSALAGNQFALDTDGKMWYWGSNRCWQGNVSETVEDFNRIANKLYNAKYGCYAPCDRNGNPLPPPPPPPSPKPVTQTIEIPATHNGFPVTHYRIHPETGVHFVAGNYAYVCYKDPSMQDKVYTSCLLDRFFSTGPGSYFGEKSLPVVSVNPAKDPVIRVEVPA